jgi:hypothetical protein
MTTLAFVGLTLLINLQRPDFIDVNFYSFSEVFKLSTCMMVMYFIAM